MLLLKFADVDYILFILIQELDNNNANDLMVNIVQNYPVIHDIFNNETATGALTQDDEDEVMEAHLEGQYNANLDNSTESTGLIELQADEVARILGDEPCG